MRRHATTGLKLRALAATIATVALGGTVLAGTADAGSLTLSTGPVVSTVSTTLTGLRQTIPAQLGNYEVDDGTTTGNGWALTVNADSTQAGGLISQYNPSSSSYVTGGYSFPAGSLVYNSSGDGPFTAQNGATGPAPTAQCSTGCMLDSTTPAIVASAAPGAGEGYWQTQTAANDIGLTVPGNVLAGTYQVVLDWNLTSGYEGSNGGGGNTSNLPFPQTSPAITGTTTVGQTLTVSNGTWSNSPTGYSYQWFDCTGSGGTGCTQIAGATSSTYTLQGSDAGFYMKAIVTATNTAGSVTAPAVTTSTVVSAPVNTVAPTVTGTAAVGSALTASPGSWTYSPTSYSYQWQDCTGSTAGAGTGCTNISGATSTTYTLTATDAGDYVQVTVTATNQAGTGTATAITSTAIVSGPPTVVTAPTVSGTAAVGHTVQASSSQWANSPTGYTYQWQSCTSGGSQAAYVSSLGTGPTAFYQLQGNGSDSTGNYTAATVHGGVTYGNAGPFPGSTSASFNGTNGWLQAPSQPISNTSFSIEAWVKRNATGGYQVIASQGSTTNTDQAFGMGWMSANTFMEQFYSDDLDTSGTYTDLGWDQWVETYNHSTGAQNIYENGVLVAGPRTAATTTTFTGPFGIGLDYPGSIQNSFLNGQVADLSVWSGTALSAAQVLSHYQAASTGTCTNVGANASGYVVQPSDAGHYLTVTVTATNAAGSTPVTSTPTSSVLGVPTATTNPSISGNAYIGQTLTASPGAWTYSPSSYSYQWEDCTGSTAGAGTGCTNISGATSSTYKVASSDSGDYIVVTVAATNAAGTGSAFSTPTTAVIGTPANTITPAITGTTAVGQTLTASTGTWTYSPTSYAYQWWDCTGSGTGCTTITGATSATYKAVASDAGDYLQVVVTATNAAGSGTSPAVTSSTVVNTPTNQTIPAITGTAAVTQTLTASTGTWTYSPASYAYQWADCTGISGSTGTGCSNISGATSQTYKLASADTADYVIVQVTATNAAGTSTAAVSNATAQITGPPTNSAAPTVSGSTLAGSGTVTVTNGTWTGSPSYTYQWYDCPASTSVAPTGCTTITGATSASYAVKDTDALLYVAAVVTATNAAGTATATVTDTTQSLTQATAVWGQTTFTSSTSGTSTTALATPAGVAIDSSGGMYVADFHNNRVVYFPYNSATGLPSTTANRVWGQAGNFTTRGNGASATTLKNPEEVALAPTGGFYVVDEGNNRVLYFAPGSGCTAPNTPSGCGTATAVYGQATFTSTNQSTTATGLSIPTGIAVDSSGDLYVVDNNNNRVVEYPGSTTDPATTTATRVWGQAGSFTTNTTGTSTTALHLQGNLAGGITVSSTGGLYVSDNANNRVLYFPPGSGCTAPNTPSGCGTATAVYGQSGSFTTLASGVTATTLNDPGPLTLDSAGDLYIDDYSNNRVLYYPAGTGCTAPSTPTGCGTATRAYGDNDSLTGGSGSVSASYLAQPEAVALGDNGLFIADYTNNRVLYFP